MAKIAKPIILVLAGTNGAGKSTIYGAALLDRSGLSHFNPDEEARRLREADPGLSQVEANGLAWRTGLSLLDLAMVTGRNYAFETTLGGKTIVRRLERAIEAGFDVRVWYVGLATPEMHIARVRTRVAHGGHDIPEADVRRRFRTSVENLIRLMPRLTELRVFDNSIEGDPVEGIAPQPALLLHMKAGKVLFACPTTDETPQWAIELLKVATGVR